MADCLCILCHFTAKKLVGIAVRIMNGVKTAGTNTAAAAFAFIIINDCFFLRICDRITSAFFRTTLAASTDICFDNRFATVVLRHFSSAAAAAHTNILDSSAETSRFMPFKMGKTNENISIHNGTSNSGGGAIFCIFYRNFNVICSAKSVTDNDLTACGNGVKSVQICTVHMFQGIFTASWIKSITVCKKWHAPLFLTKIGYCFCVIRTQESQISKLSKMHFDSNKFTIHVNILDPCCDT